MNRDTPPYLLVGYDEKVTWEDGRIRFLAPGRDSLGIFDLTNPALPTPVANLPVANSVFGPPTNLAVTPDGRLGLLADSMAWPADGDGFCPAPGNQLHIIDLTTCPPALAQTLSVGHQPSGLAIHRAGTLALVANRASASVSVLRIAHGQVQVIDEVDVGSPVVAVSIAPDGRRAFVAKLDTHRLGVLRIDGDTVSHDPAEDIVTGLVPYNLAITPDGTRALTVDMGSPTASDGHADTVSVIDLTASPPRVIDKIMVEDGPEGLAMSPDGRHAAVAIVQGSNTPRDTWYHHPRGSVVLLRIEDGRVTRGPAMPVGALPEGLAFSPCGQMLYVGNFLDATLQVLGVQDGRLIDRGTCIPLPGHPASLRTQSF